MIESTKIAQGDELLISRRHLSDLLDPSVRVAGDRWIVQSRAVDPHAGTVTVFVKGSKSGRVLRVNADQHSTIRRAA